MTGYAEHVVLRNSNLEAGMHTITKPFTLAALLTKILAIAAEN